MLLNEEPFGRQIEWDSCKNYQCIICNVLQMGVVFVVCNFFLPDKNSFQVKPNGYSCPVELLVFSGVRDLFCV